MYSRSNRTQEKKAKDSQHCQKSLPQDFIGIQGNIPTESISNFFFDLSLPIEKGKSIRNAPKYLISMFVSYKKFVSQLFKLYFTTF